MKNRQAEKISFSQPLSLYYFAIPLFYALWIPFIRRLIAKHTKIKEGKWKKRKAKGKKRSDNKGRWDRIHFSISCFIHPYSLETGDCERMNDNLFAQKFSIILISSLRFTRVEEIFRQRFSFSSFVHEKWNFYHSVLILFCTRALRCSRSVNYLPRKTNHKFIQRFSWTVIASKTTRKTLIGKFLHVEIKVSVKAPRRLSARRKQ